MFTETISDRSFPARRSRIIDQADSKSLDFASILITELNKAGDNEKQGLFSAHRKRECNSFGDESKWRKTETNRSESGSIPVLSRADSRVGPGERAGSVSRSEIVLKASGEDAGSVPRSGFARGVGIGGGGSGLWDGCEGHLIRGFPGTENHDWPAPWDNKRVGFMMAAVVAEARALRR